MIINQPYDEQLGVQLIRAIESGKYTQLTIMVAYAKLSGVYRISPYVEEFRKNGGTVRCVVGVDQQNTTYDALLHLLTLSNNVSVFHTESISQTFHVKCYWLTGNKTCWYTIGSNNLTAGGLFSNYEMSSVVSLTGDDANKANDALEEIYVKYADPTASVCSHKLDNAFLNELLSEGYVIREIQQRKSLAKIAQQTRVAASKKKKLFGNEIFPAPALPEQYQATKSKARSKKSGTEAKIKPKSVIQVPPVAASSDDNSYLIRLVPGAGNRSKQVHFTVSLLKEYFRLFPGDTILVQEMLPTGAVGQIEHRQVVFSERNRNVKIELSGASMLDDNYPTNLETRPVLILKRVNANLFVYMILLDGHDGYAPINNRLKSLRKVGNALQYEVIDESTMFSLWGDCPIT